MQTQRNLDMRMPAGLPAAAFRAAEDLSACASLAEVSALFAETVAAVGMDASVSAMVSGPVAVSEHPFHFVNWPAEWLVLYRERGFARADPVPRWAIASGAAASWSEIMAALPAKDPGHEAYRAARDLGLREGFVTPVRTAKGDLGLVSAGGDRGGLDTEERLFLQTVSVAALQRADALLKPARDAGGAVLSLRERECVQLLGQGFTDRDISQVLKVSAATTRFHIDNAKKKLGARSRAHLILLVGRGPD
jgi:DNA-binding CsgD family transcriptional regulator